MKELYFSQSKYKYEKALSRLQKSLQSGRFATYSQQKKRQIWNRLSRYANQLGIKIKASVAAACIAAGLSIGTTASAQTFTLRTGTANPFNGVDIGTSAIPAFVDIDNDGDGDAFIGRSDGTIAFYKNAGTAAAPVFILQTGASDPFNGINVGYYAAPTFVDIDNDGDFDAFIGEYSAGILYYKNTGTNSTPVFTLTTGASNPLNNVGAIYLSNPTFVDIDNDGDMDAFIGHVYGDIRYYKNTGTASAAVFTLQTGASDPLDGLVAGYYSAPAFVDVDNDGDFDLFVGTYYGTVTYYKNTGSASAPVFTLQTGASDPFDGVNVGVYSTPTFWDIDNDGDMDAFIGNDDGAIIYYENTSINLPLRLLSFSGNRQSGFNQLEWLTADELNTKWFDVEVSTDGINFKKITTVIAAGNGNNKYNVKDEAFYSGKVFYRLKMIDIDGRFTYSPIISINIKLLTGITIYPNPVKSRININIDNDKLLGTRAKIYDANGRLVQNVLLNTYQVFANVGPLSKGMYLVKFADGSGKTFMKE